MSGWTWILLSWKVDRVIKQIPLSDRKCSCGAPQSVRSPVNGCRTSCRLIVRIVQANHWTIKWCTIAIISRGLNHRYSTNAESLLTIWAKCRGESWWNCRRCRYIHGNRCLGERSVGMGYIIGNRIRSWISISNTYRSWNCSCLPIPEIPCIDRRRNEGCRVNRRSE